MRNKYYKRHKDLIRASVKAGLQRANERKKHKDYMKEEMKWSEKVNRVKRILESIQGDFDEN